MVDIFEEMLQISKIFLTFRTFLPQSQNAREFSHMRWGFSTTTKTLFLKGFGFRSSGGGGVEELQPPCQRRQAPLSPLPEHKLY